MLETTDITLRLLAATVIGMVIGTNRDARGKPAGMRTMGLIALGAAMIGVTATHLTLLQTDPNAISRTVQGVIQGVMAGIGFLGAGVLIQKRLTLEVHGMTTAAAIWATAALGITAGLGVWPAFLIGAVIVLLLLIVAHPMEEWVERRAARRKDPEGEA
ncbi:MgtC/SapB family protein [Asticcacaulis sp. AND118]|uniref:MgtC/SapB family protein n=1 Tax=Asticcacaulis sp. AND118 TaxID=2840468 RepID=UPI001D000031|nr:MgtC/SapB family protein [Asticcacaulis sp. AND118]UDF05419.1 MgtC/SapB family protein [Asticcacaulis sp. AND118]